MYKEYTLYVATIFNMHFYANNYTFQNMILIEKSQRLWKLHFTDNNDMTKCLKLKLFLKNGNF